MITQGSAKYPVTEVMLHTSATSNEWWVGKTADKMRDEIRKWHMNQGWRNIGYHRVFAPDGTMATGRSIYEIGAGCMDHNRGVIHLCMIPIAWIDRIGTFDDWYTREQRIAVRDYLLELEELHGKPLKVTGHNDYANKLCPGFHVVSDEWL